MVGIKSKTDVRMGFLGITIKYELCYFPERYLLATVSKWAVGNEAWLMNERGRFGRWKVYGYFGSDLQPAKSVATLVENVIASQSQRPYFIVVDIWGKTLGCTISLHRPTSTYNIRLRDMLVEAFERFEL